MNNKGFTLIEVLAVIVILSVIMGLALPAFTSTMESNKRKNEILYNDKVIAAAELYVADYKYSMYEKKGDNSTCLISKDDLLNNGYFLPSEMEMKTVGVIYYFDNHTYEYTEDADNGIARCNGEGD